LSQRHDGAGVRAKYERPEIVYNPTPTKNRRSRQKQRSDWEAAILVDWLKLARLERWVHAPRHHRQVDVALDEQLAASVWSKLFPAPSGHHVGDGGVLSGDRPGAGEKERGTMETRSSARRPAPKSCSGSSSRSCSSATTAL